jgi:hypothetical protein
MILPNDEHLQMQHRSTTVAEQCVDTLDPCAECVRFTTDARTNGSANGSDISPLDIHIEDWDLLFSAIRQRT